MTHLWMRAESRDHEARAGLTAQGAAELIARGYLVTVEESRQRALPLGPYREAGCAIAAEGSWPSAPREALIFGLKELPDDGTPLVHRHIMFGHAFKGQPAGQVLLRRFAAGGGALYDIEYLVDETGRRIAAFGTWAGFAGAAVALHCWAAQQKRKVAGPVGVHTSAHELVRSLEAALSGTGPRPRALIIGALGRVGRGAADLCHRLDVPVTKWDIKETAHGGPFPEVLQHEVLLNCILATPGCPVFVPAETPSQTRRLTVIGDIACDPTSDFSPIRVYDRTTTWEAPALRVHDDPPLDVIAIDNLPAMLPAESSVDFAAQLLPALLALDRLDQGVWGRAAETYRKHAVPKES